MNSTSEVKVFLLAGIKTSPSAFFALQEQLKHELRMKGFIADIEILFPYGEFERNVIMQIAEVRADLSRWLKSAGIGAKKVWNKIEPHIHMPKIILIGHSGGGVAAYRAARKIYEDQLPVTTHVIQIGSPKTKIMEPLRKNVSYIHAIDSEGNMKDPITRLGSWGGWSIKNDTIPIPYWDGKKYAPERILSVDTLGGHADYFRQGARFTDELSRCNLDKTLAKIDHCLNEWL